MLVCLVVGNHVSLVVGNKYWLTKKHTILVFMQKSPFMKKVYRSFSLTSRDVTAFFPAYFSEIFSMFCIEQAKIYVPRAKIWERQSVWWQNYRETKMWNTCLINMRAPCWFTTLVHQHGGHATKAQIKPNFNRNGQI